MLFLFTAIYPEGRPFIEHYALRKMPDNKFDIFMRDDIVLCVTGVGKVNSSVAVSHVLTIFDAKEVDIAVNIGIAAGRQFGNRYLINSIVDFDTERRFYPDMIRDIDLEEAWLTTVSVPASQEQIRSSDSLFDMEGSGFFTAASAYLPPHNIIVLKCISDKGTDSGTVDITIEKISELTSAFIPVTDGLRSALEPRKIYHNEDEFERLANELKCSEYMRNELKQIIRYLETEDRDIMTLIDRPLPVSTRKEGRAVLDEIFSRLC